MNNIETQKSYFLDYLQNEKRYSIHTVEGYKNDLDGFVKHIAQYGVNTMSQIQTDLVRDWLIYLKENNYTSKSIHRKRSALLSWFKFLVRKEYIPKMPFDEIIVPKIEQRLPIFATQKDMQKLFDGSFFPNDFAGKIDKMILYFFYYTGVRVSELVSIKIQDLDFGNRLVKIAHGKGGKNRLIPLLPILEEELHLYIKEKADFFNKRVIDDHLFVSEKGKPLGRTSVYLIVKKYLGAATTLDKTSPHVLRHTFATHLLEEGADINAIKELLGHSSLASTQVYTHLNIKKLKETYKKAHPKK